MKTFFKAEIQIITGSYNYFLAVGKIVIERAPEVKIFSFISDSEKEASKEELINKATSSATLCTYFPLTPWLETKEDVFVDGVEALLSTSYLICMKGGKVKITNDGQYS